MRLKLGLDIGVASVGWGIIDENYQIIDCGVRIFPENTAKENVDRRTARSTRRRLRRRQHRLDRLEKVLSKALSIEKPMNVAEIYEIRCRGLQDKLSKDELFCAIMHLAKRRGTHFLTAEDFDKVDGENKSTEEILHQQAEKLQDKYVCEIQYEKLHKHGKVRGIENRFHNKDYRKELVALLNKQGEYYPNIKDIKDKILEIYDSKREYFQGPGGSNSPTPYGCYRYNEDGQMVKVNLIDLMRGTCTFFPEEKRIAYNSYTACLFNILNDLNNMKAAGLPISYEQKRELIETYINEGKNINLQNIAKVTGKKSGELRGYRIDKNGKPIFTEFAGYKAILKALQKANLDTSFIKGNRELVDTIADILSREKDVDRRFEELTKQGIDSDAAEELKKLAGFTKYHSLSKKAIELILDDLLETDENQMQLFNKIGLFEQKNVGLQGVNIPFEGSDWIVSPITKRAVNESIKIINEARNFVRKNFNCEFAEIVIEMAREKNSDEKVAFINEMQKKNENLRQQIGSLVDLKKINGKQFEILKLLLEQDFKCAYSLKHISLNHVFTGCVEVDHIIPRSLSFDNSHSNKVAVLVEENQKKGQTTPYRYLKSWRGQISYDEYKNWVLSNENYKKNKKKRENLLYEGNPLEDLKDFVNRNLVDTRYACRKVLNLLQAYFKENQLDTKVSVIKGSFTHAFRKMGKLDKNREATYAHHAQDALIVAGLSNTKLIKKVHNLLQKDKQILDEKEGLDIIGGKLVNTVTGEKIEEDDFKVNRYIQFIKNIDKVTPKYSHKVDRKPNRMLYDQQIKATRTKDGKTYFITKYKNIYDKGSGNNGEKLKGKILKEPEKLLMYHHDPKTFEIFKQIVEAYPESKNPFAEYFAEHGPIRKYSKKGNGPIISDVKFYDRVLRSHRENLKQQGKNKSVYLAIKTLRADFYLDNGMYKFVSVPYDMVKESNGDFYIEWEKYKGAKQAKKISDDAHFLFSLYRGEVFGYEKEGKWLERYYKCINNDKTNRIDIGFIDKPTAKQETEIIGKKIKKLTKYHVDILGNKYSVKQEKFSLKVSV